MKRIRWGDILMTGICILLGFVIVVQLRSVYKNSTITKTTYDRADELQVLLNQEKEKSDGLYQQLLQYKDSLDKYSNEAAKSGDYAQVLDDQLKRAEILAGLTDVEGSGVIVTMKDAVGANEGQDPATQIIHDDDIFKVINELRDAGAEAISINDERVLATSEIRCTGATVSINNNRYAAPYIIKAIGDTTNLEAALNMRYGVIEVLSSWNIEVSVVKSNKIKIKAYTGALNFKYAQNISKEG